MTSNATWRPPFQPAENTPTFTSNISRPPRLMVDESMVKSASQGISAGCGVRVVVGERTGYAYTDDLSSERILHAARTAALIASGPAKTPVGRLPGEARTQSLSGNAAVGGRRNHRQGRTGDARRRSRPAPTIRASRKFAPAMPTSCATFWWSVPTAPSPKTRSPWPA